MTEKLRIAIATSGRFHVLDLARELAAPGHDVAFYSYVPKSRAVRFGLPAASHRSLLRRLWPLVLLLRTARTEAVQRFFERRLALAMDRRVARAIEPCDVFIGMSGMYLAAGQAAQGKYGALYVIERGSRHILSQKEILDAMPGQDGKPSAVPDFYIKRDLAGYAASDMISVPSRHVETSFLDRGIASCKMFRNPYGVDLDMFPPTEAPDPSVPPTILYVGSWTWQKGVDVLVDAWRMLPDVRLVHVGPTGNVPLPSDDGFDHVAPVPQWRLPEFYGQAHAFALASRQEGLSLVLIQALACGLPVVCTDRTGGEDLQAMLPQSDRVTVVPHDDSRALAAGLRNALARYSAQTGVRDGLGAARAALSWQAYGKRYEAELLRRVRGRQQS